MNLKEKFTEVYKINEWGDSESRSGGGSTLKSTAKIREWLPQIIEKYNIQSMLDAPCGDFNWMKEVKFPKNFIYIGADIVDEMIRKNQRKYSRAFRNFIIRDLTKDPLPRMDLMLCKDLFLHLSFEDSWSIIRNFKASGAKYLIASNYLSHKTNKDQKTGGAWRQINLQTDPFNFPYPIELLETKDVSYSMFVLDTIPLI